MCNRTPPPLQVILSDFDSVRIATHDYHVIIADEIT